MRLLLTLVLFAHSVDAQCDDGNEEGCTSTLVAAPNTVVVGDAIACALTAAVLTETCTGTATDTAVTCGTAGATVALCEAGCTHFPTVVGSCADTDAQLATCVYVAPVASTVEAAGEACMAATASCSACEDDEASGALCADKIGEHCAEIACCPSCEAEITAMFACEHASGAGSICPAGDALTCPAPACDTAAAEAAELAIATCQTTNGCTCSEVDFGEDCVNNKREHCAEIECCPLCAAEITASFVCEHGTACPNEVPLTCTGCAWAEAEETCMAATASCSACEDNEASGALCADKIGEHCDEIACCPSCEVEITAVFACEHASGTSSLCPVGEPLTCPAPAAAVVVAPAPDTSAAQRSDVAGPTGLLAAALGSYVSLW